MGNFKIIHMKRVQAKEESQVFERGKNSNIFLKNTKERPVYVLSLGLKIKQTKVIQNMWGI